MRSGRTALSSVWCAANDRNPVTRGGKPAAGWKLAGYWKLAGSRRGAGVANVAGVTTLANLVNLTLACPSG